MKKIDFYNGNGWIIYGLIWGIVLYTIVWIIIPLLKSRSIERNWIVEIPSYLLIGLGIGYLTKILNKNKA